MRKLIWITAIPILLLLLAMQLRRPDFNLSAVNETATFDTIHSPTPQIENMLHRSCYDCHSTQVAIPWYGHVWPASELLQNDVRKGRARLDFSNWDHLSPEMSKIRLIKACRSMRASEMPLWYYRPMHPGSAPKAGDVEAFCVWVNALPAGSEVAQLH